MPLCRELNYQGKTPLLYLVATPIGNLGEMTSRAISVLQTMDFIACEDTRNSGLLLQHFGIDKPLLSCHEHNEEEAAQKIVTLLKDGKKVAYMSDAGYPSISDPGLRLERRCLEEGFKVAVLNGPSAALCALVGSGLDSQHFLFYGFLDSKPSSRKKELQELKECTVTMIFYESPHRIGTSLRDMASAFGESRKAVIAREMTKTHEEYIRGTLGELLTLDTQTLIGEMAVVVEGKPHVDIVFSDEDLIALLKKEQMTSSPKESITKIAHETKVPKNRIYELYLQTFKKK